MAEWIELIFGAVATVGLSYTVFYGNSGISKHKGTSLLKLVPLPDYCELSQYFCFFCHAMLINASVIKLVRPSKVYRTEQPPLFTGA